MNNSSTFVIFGANGRTGKEIVSQMLEMGIDIRAVSRCSYNGRKATGLTYFKTTYSDPKQLQHIVKDASAVIIVFGPKPPYADIFCAKFTENIITAMKLEGVSKLICLTGAMVGDYRKNRSYIFQLMCSWFKHNNPQAYEDRRLQEELIKCSGLDWTIIKPPKLTDADSKEVLAGEETRVGLFSSVSRKSLANYIIKVALDTKHRQNILFVKNR